MQRRNNRRHAIEEGRHQAGCSQIDSSSCAGCCSVRKGPEAEVRLLFSKIERDLRHEECELVNEETPEHRRYVGFPSCLSGQTVKATHVSMVVGMSNGGCSKAN